MTVLVDIGGFLGVVVAKGVVGFSDFGGCGWVQFFLFKTTKKIKII